MMIKRDIVIIVGIISLLLSIFFLAPQSGIFVQNNNSASAQAQQQATSPNSVNGINHGKQFISLHNPLISDLDKQAIISAAMNYTGIKAWSPIGWQFVSMDFMGTTTTPTVSWKYAVVNLHLPSDVHAPAACDTGWWAMVQVDLASKTVVRADYPSISSHVCHGDLVLGKPRE